MSTEVISGTAAHVAAQWVAGAAEAPVEAAAKQGATAGETAPAAAAERKPQPKAAGARKASSPAAKPKAGAPRAGTTKATRSTKVVAKGAGQVAAAKTGYASATSEKAWAFLDDPKIGIDEKLLRFMHEVSRQNRTELLDRMKEYETAKAAEKKKSSSPLSKVTSKLTPTLVKNVLKQVSGPLLAAAATGLGFPQLAPLALKLSPAIADLLGGLVSGALTQGATGSSSGTTRSTAAKAEERDPQMVMMEIQVLMERQKELFSMVSATMRANHETRMAAVQNMR
jgi:hypothetical protein